MNDVPLLEGFIALAEPDRLSAPTLAGGARSSAQRLGSVFLRLRQQQRDLALVELFDAVVEQTGYKASFDEDSEEEMQRWANVLELRSDLEQYAILPPEEALPTYLEQVALVSDVDSMDENGRGRVTLITLHSAKGLEFPVVFIAGVEEGLLPISRAVEAEPFDASQLEEERRLFYVGITRAEKMLYITFAANRQPLRSNAIRRSFSLLNILASRSRAGTLELTQDDQQSQSKVTHRSGKRSIVSVRLQLAYIWSRKCRSSPASQLCSIPSRTAGVSPKIW